ncbi:MAG: ribonuclease HII [Candidatus Altiarchaeota archaeon]|nr:ribonuclease HII [Candidatus Altiarchaeota archaeon]
MTGTFCGIDEAGRGPVIGPMVLACAVFDDGGMMRLAELKVRDSKKLSPARRSYLEPLVKDVAIEYGLAIVSAGEIDLLRKRKSLNVIEAMKVAQLICSLKNTPARIVVDAADAVAENYRTSIIKCAADINSDFRMPHLVSEHKADDNYLEVSAASILAKVERDRRIEELKKTHGDFGSGYPADETTKEYVKSALKSGLLPDIVRKSWNTVSAGKQKTLDDY